MAACTIRPPRALGAGQGSSETANLVVANLLSDILLNGGTSLLQNRRIRDEVKKYKAIYDASYTHMPADSISTSFYANTGDLHTHPDAYIKLAATELVSSKSLQRRIIEFLIRTQQLRSS